uniref:NADH-ubiquinone oxidoreductase chain 2 n=1 Tax=Processina sexmaculata TaxID=2906307 RepID=A0A977TM52_9HEMI|nr:NADH dehydrogenase subunit 2 [Processina sexmaculata]UXX17579.1 NADH dehydrogenase subunit 2 [Processina sexmaculata]
MKFNLTNILLLYMMMMGILLTVSSNNWMMMWSGLEISLMSFIPLMSGGVIGSESSMKYFIVQSISSAMLIMSIMFMISMNGMYYFLMTVSLSMKMGVAPFHNWILSMISSLTFFMLFILLTLMKIAPLVMLSYLNSYYDLLIFFSLMFGSIFSLNQNSTRKLLGYSSIYNMGYMLSSINMNYIWMMYLFIYSTILLVLVLMMSKLKINYLNQFMINEHSMSMKMNLWVTMLSMGGMPPLMGFFPKFIIFQMMIIKKMFLLLLMMILTSLIVMFFYIRMVILSFINYSMVMKHNMKSFTKISFWSFMMNTNFFPILILLKSLN